MGRLPLLYFQVGYFRDTSCLKSSNYCLVAVSCPPDLRDKMFRTLLFLSCLRRKFASLLLLLSGDIESNPGPGVEETLAIVLDTVRRLEAGQNTIIGEIKGLKEKQDATDKEIKSLTMRVVTLEAKLVSNAPPSSNFADGAIGSISDQLQAVVSRCDEAENRMRRCNLLFFGIPDEHKESWETSENKIIAPTFIDN
nr:uncharacterized protein LOC119175508 [Rhipicephalus microplus]